MDIFINLFNDLVIVIGNIIIFSCMLDFKSLKLSHKIIISVLCLIFAVAYSLCVYLYNVPLIHATILCFTLPSLITFWCFSKIKDTRFFLSFCIVDTVSLIIAFITKVIAHYSAAYAPFITLAINLIIYSLIIIYGYKFLHQYAQLMMFQKTGWLSMMIASFIIYFAFYFLASYPVPLIQRLEAVPGYFVFCIVVLSCYVVFWDSIVKSRKLYEQNNELETEKHYHKIAYTDALTGLYNRAFYIKKINDLERNIDDYQTICCVVMDINNFKNVNDRFGHYIGDLVLQDTANHIRDLLKNVPSFIFRIGGDEFFVLLPNIDEETVHQKLDQLNSLLEHNEKVQGSTLSVASGYSIMDCKNENPKLTIEQHFMIADKLMYENKNQYKLAHPQENDTANETSESDEQTTSDSSL